jgi:ABC-type multidrug transport system permease subunit
LLAETWVAMGMGYLLVTLIENMAIADTCASFILLLCIWYSGDFAFNPNCTWILRWLAYLSPIFYSFNALANNQFGGTKGRGEKILVDAQLNNFGLWPSIGALLGFGLLYMAAGYFALSFSTRPNRTYI